MLLRIMIRMRAKPGRGAELLGLMEQRGVGVRQEPGCEDFEVFQSGHDPDHLCLLELWTDQAAIDAHAARNAAGGYSPAIAEARVEGPMLREDYTYVCSPTVPRKQAT